MIYGKSARFTTRFTGQTGSIYGRSMPAKLTGDMMTPHQSFPRPGRPRVGTLTMGARPRAQAPGFGGLGVLRLVQSTLMLLVFLNFWA